MKLRDLLAGLLSHEKVKIIVNYDEYGAYRVEELLHRDDIEVVKDHKNLLGMTIQEKGIGLYVDKAGDVIAKDSDVILFNPKIEIPYIVVKVKII